MTEQKESSLITVKNEDSFKTSYSTSTFCVLYFWADWHNSCKQIQSVLSELSSDHKELQFYSINAEEFEDLTSFFNVESVPTIILCKKQTETKRLEGQSIPNTVNTIKQFANHSQTESSLKDLKPNKNKNKNKNQEKEKESTQQLNQRIAKLIAAAPIMLFMKGTPQEPKCKFSRATVEILAQQNVTKYGYFNILNDESVRSQIKIYSNWKTFPQLYINNKLIGGLDVIKEKIEDNEFKDLLPQKTNDLNAKLEKLINKGKIMLFIKGTPSSPKCGFSNQIIQILKQQNVNNFAYFNILEDMEVREGLKTYSNWPTYPQLYIKGKLIGGLDVVKEMIEDDEFKDTINI